MTLRQVVISVPMQQSGQGLGSAWRRVEMDWTIGLEGIFIWFPWSRNTQLNWHSWRNWQIEFKIFSNFESCKYYFLQCRCWVEAWSVFGLAAWCVVFWSLHLFMFSVSCCFILWAARAFGRIFFSWKPTLKALHVCTVNWGAPGSWAGLPGTWNPITRWCVTLSFRRVIFGRFQMPKNCL